MLHGRARQSMHNVATFSVVLAIAKLARDHDRAACSLSIGHSYWCHRACSIQRDRTCWAKVYVCMRTRAFVCVYMVCVCACVRACVHACVRAYVHACVHTCTYVYSW